jgi:hypothetical protein
MLLEGVPCAILGPVIHNDHPQLGICTNRFLQDFRNILHEMSFVVNWDDEPLVQGRIHRAGDCATRPYCPRARELVMQSYLCN